MWINLLNISDFKGPAKCGSFLENNPLAERKEWDSRHPGGIICLRMTGLSFRPFYASQQNDTITTDT